MNDLEALSAELEALKQRVALLEASATQKPKMVYNWHLRSPEQPTGSGHDAFWEIPQPAIHGTAPVYEHYVDPAMRMTRNGN